jgi:hypothetical protein
MYLSNLTYSTNFSFNHSSIQFVNIDNTNKYYKDKPIFLLYGLNLSYKITSISVPQNITVVLKYYNKSLLIINASPEFDSENEIVIPYGTDLTNYNKTTFRQSIIDHTLINSPWINMQNKITIGEKYFSPIKTSVCEDIYPKTTNTMLTVYYTSYIKANIPQTTDTTRKQMLRYFCANDTYPAFAISDLNSTYYDFPRLYVVIYNKGYLTKDYILTPNESKVGIDLTAELALYNPGEEIISPQFTPNEYQAILDAFYKDCVNILSNVFISYIYL